MLRDAVDANVMVVVVVVAAAAAVATVAGRTIAVAAGGTAQSLVAVGIRPSEPLLAFLHLVRKKRIRRRKRGTSSESP